MITITNQVLCRDSIRRRDRARKFNRDERTKERRKKRREKKSTHARAERDERRTTETRDFFYSGGFVRGARGAKVPDARRVVSFSDAARRRRRRGEEATRTRGMENALGLGYGSSDGEGEREDADEEEDEDEEAFVGPARPPAGMMMTTTMTDGDGDGDGEETAPACAADADWLASLVRDGDAEEEGDATSPTAPERFASKVEWPPAKATSSSSVSSQDLVNGILLESKRRGVTPHDLMFTSSTFRNPEFMLTCAKDGCVGLRGAFATGVAFDFGVTEDVEEEDSYKSLAEEQKTVTEKHLAERNGISFRSSGFAPNAPRAASQPSQPDAAQQAAVNAAIAKARVEARIALERAGKR